MPFDIASQSPANGATNVYLNSNIQVTFSGALLASSVTDETVILTDLASNRPVIGSVTYDSTLNRIYFNPENYLSPSTNYRYTLVGSDLAIGTPLTDATGMTLTGSLKYLFSTGLELDYRDEERHKNSLTESLEGDLELPANIAVIGSEFTVANYTPKMMASDVLETTTQFIIEFTKTLDTGNLTQDQVSVSFYPLMDDDDYLAKTINGSLVLKKDSSDSQSAYFSDPDYSISASGKYLYINLSGEIHRNEFVEIVIDKDIKSATGDTLANEDIIWEFSTQLYPDLAGVRSVKREISTIADTLKNSYISALLHKNIFMGYEMARSQTPLSGSNKSLRNFAKWMTIVDILEDKDVEKALEAGIRRQIGDYSVSVDANVLGKMSIKLSQAMKKAEKSLDSLQKESGVRVVCSPFMYQGQLPDRLWHGVNNRIVDDRFRFWQPDIPASNLSIERAAEVPEKFGSW